MKTQTFTGTLAAETPTELVLGVNTYRHAEILISNTGGTNAINSVSLSTSPVGERFAPRTDIAAAIASIEPGASKVISLPVSCHSVKLAIESEVGTTYTIELALFAGYIGGPAIVDGAEVLQSVTGPQKQSVGPFYETLAADETNEPLIFGAAGGAWVAPRAGSITAISAILGEAITGADQTVTLQLFLNGVAVTELDLEFTEAGAEVVLYATAASGAHAFAAGDTIDLGYTSDTITNTPTIIASVEVEC
jgi:hypothetical protein